MNRITIWIEGTVVTVMGLLSLVEGMRLNKLRGIQIQYDIFGPGNYSLGLGVVLIILGLVYMISELEKGLVVKKVVDKGLRRKLINMIVVLVVYGFLIPIIGYLSASMVFFILMFRVVGFISWLHIMALSLGISISYYVIFVRLLGIEFPVGILIP